MVVLLDQNGGGVGDLRFFFCPFSTVGGDVGFCEVTIMCYRLSQILTNDCMSNKKQKIEQEIGWIITRAEFMEIGNALKLMSSRVQCSD